jgi:hypothetical protein
MFKIIRTSHCTHSVLEGTTQTRFLCQRWQWIKNCSFPLDSGALCLPIRNLRIVVLFNHLMTLFHANCMLNLGSYHIQNACRFHCQHKSVNVIESNNPYLLCAAQEYRNTLCRGNAKFQCCSRWNTELPLDPKVSCLFYTSYLSSQILLSSKCCYYW